MCITLDIYEAQLKGLKDSWETKTNLLWFIEKSLPD